MILSLGDQAEGHLKEGGDGHNFVLGQELCCWVVVKWDVGFLLHSLLEISPVYEMLLII